MILQISTAAYHLSYLHVLQTLSLIPAHAFSGHVALPASHLLNTCHTNSTAAVAFGLCSKQFDII